MTYRAEFEGLALTQLKGLPEAAFDALVERVADIAREPRDTDQRRAVRCARIVP